MIAAARLPLRSAPGSRVRREVESGEGNLTLRLLTEPTSRSPVIRLLIAHSMHVPAQARNLFMERFSSLFRLREQVRERGNYGYTLE